jgi:hypothetical protein
LGIFLQNTTYTYDCSVRTANGTTPTVTISTNTGNATLSATNFNLVKCFGVTGGANVDIYRMVGGTTQGKIENVPNSNGNSSDALIFKNTGLTGTAPALPPQTRQENLLYLVLQRQRPLRSLVLSP